MTIWFKISSCFQGNMRLKSHILIPRVNLEHQWVEKIAWELEFKKGLSALGNWSKGDNLLSKLDYLPFGKKNKGHKWLLS